jgi:hypothetical protein
MNGGRLSRDTKSHQISVLLHELMAVPAGPRRRVIAESCDARELRFLLAESMRELGTPFALWHDTPSGFVEDVLGETVWSTQRDILDAVPRYKRVLVPAGFGVGKTHLAARSVLHHVMTRPVGAALAVTTATRFRQVRYQLWPHIRRAHARAGLPGTCDTTQLKLVDPNGVETVVAYGFSAPANDEAAMQGVHCAGGLLLVVDEAGGIPKIIGSGTNNLLTGDARMLAIGNPAMDEPRSWFEQVCEEGEDPEQEGSTTIQIPATASPAITGEDAPICRECVPNLDQHTICRHVVDQDWVDRTINDFGPDHPYVIAKVYAKFPRGGAGLALPVTWVEAAMQAPDPTGPEYVRLCDLGLTGETETFTIRRGSWVRLGVDVAGSGGDECAVYRVIGDVVHKRYTSAGPENVDQVRVAEHIKSEIHAAERLAKALGSPYPVRVKIDQNGIGHGATSMLKRWAEAGQFDAQIIGVMVSESPEHNYADIPQRPKLKRDEAWLAARQLVRPDPSTGAGQLRLRLDRKAFVQLSTVRMSTDAAGHAVIESKTAMRKRGMDSPDRADAVILGVYEPFPLVTSRTRGIIGG